MSWTRVSLLTKVTRDPAAIVTVRGDTPLEVIVIVAVPGVGFGVGEGEGEGDGVGEDKFIAVQNVARLAVYLLVDSE